MKIAITGLANSGKTTIFNALTGLNLETTVYATVTAEPHHGVVKVPDMQGRQAFGDIQAEEDHLCNG